jgi:hypothetical protein
MLVLVMVALLLAAVADAHVPTPVANRPLLAPSTIVATLQVARALAGADDVPRAVTELEGLASARDLEEWVAVPAIAVAVYVTVQDLCGAALLNHRWGCAP